MFILSSVIHFHSIDTIALFHSIGPLRSNANGFYSLLRLSALSKYFLFSSPLPPRFSANSFLVFLAFVDPVCSNTVLASRSRNDVMEIFRLYRQLFLSATTRKVYSSEMNTSADRLWKQGSV
jgi:hypothetical protein